MTTIVVVKKNGVAAIAGDSLTTFGNTRLAQHMDASWEKILHHAGNYFGIAGSAAHHLVMESILQHHNELTFRGKGEIFESFRKIHPVLKDEHFLNPKEEEDDPYESSQLTSLIANRSGIFGVYSMREVFEYEKFWAIGSGREFALGAMFATYDSPHSAKEIAEIGVRAGAEFDSDSSLPMTSYTLKLEN